MIMKKEDRTAGDLEFGRGEEEDINSQGGLEVSEEAYIHSTGPGVDAE